MMGSSAEGPRHLIHSPPAWLIFQVEGSEPRWSRWGGEGLFRKNVKGRSMILTSGCDPQACVISPDLSPLSAHALCSVTLQFFPKRDAACFPSPSLCLWPCDNVTVLRLGFKRHRVLLLTSRLLHPFHWSQKEDERYVGQSCTPTIQPSLAKIS